MRIQITRTDDPDVFDVNGVLVGPLGRWSRKNVEEIIHQLQEFVNVGRWDVIILPDTQQPEDED